MHQMTPNAIAMLALFFLGRECLTLLDQIHIPKMICGYAKLPKMILLSSKQETNSSKQIGTYDYLAHQISDHKEPYTYVKSSTNYCE